MKVIQNINTVDDLKNALDTVPGDYYISCMGERPFSMVINDSENIVILDESKWCEEYENDEDSIYHETHDEIDREDTFRHYGSFKGSIDDDSGWDGE